MKNAKRFLGIIAITAIIGFGFTACDDGGGNGGGGGGGGSVPKTVTFSLDKVDETTFTVTVEGAEWKTTIENANFFQFSTDQNNSQKFNPIAEYEKTSDTVYTVTVVNELIKDSPTEVTVTFRDDIKNYLGSVGNSYTTGGLPVDYPNGTTTYQLKSGKESVSLTIPAYSE
ncbi:MAG: hypothetical protein FWB83_07060 [Treponema sp.]|nr:hypothetical protein [Treponema sp.]